MWFWQCVIILAISASLIIIGSINWNREKHEFLYYNDENISTVGIVIAILSGIAVFIMLLAIIDGHTNVEASLEEYRETYTALTYKMESTTCRDEFGFLSKEVIDEVQEWNKNVRYLQLTQDNFWVGIFYPNVYDEFQTIDYESYNNGEK